MLAHPRFLAPKTRFLESFTGRADTISGLVVRGDEENFDRQQTPGEPGRELHMLNGTAGEMLLAISVSRGTIPDLPLAWEV